MWMTGELRHVSEGVGMLTRCARNFNRQDEIKELTAKGIIPHEHELQNHPEKHGKGITFLSGRVAGLIPDVLPAQMIIDNMVNEAAAIIQGNAAKVHVKAKL